MLYWYAEEYEPFPKCLLKTEFLYIGLKLNKGPCYMILRVINILMDMYIF